MRRSCIGLFIVAPAILISAQQEPSHPAEPWRWTLDERVAVRFDPAARAARVAEAEARDARYRVAAGRAYTESTASKKPSDVIDGKLHPEMFFPTELFEQLVTMAYTWNDTPFWRRAIAQSSWDILSDERDWGQLDTLVASYALNLQRDLDLLKEEGRAGRARRSEIEAERAKLHSSKCRLEKEALHRVRVYFGEERFNRFLYTAVAPQFSSSYVPENDFERTRIRLKANEEACQ